MTQIKMPENPDHLATQIAYQAGVPEEHLALWWAKWWNERGYDKPWKPGDFDRTYYQDIRLAKRIMNNLWGEIAEQALADLDAFGQEAKDANLRLCAAQNRISIDDQRKIERGIDPKK